MSSLEVEVSLGHIRAIPVVNPAPGTVVLAGPGELMGWSFRESGAETGLNAEGQQTSPGAGTTITQVVNVPVGVYNISWTVELAGTVGAGDAQNFQLLAGATSLEVSLNAGATGIYVQNGVNFQVTSVQTISVKAIGAGTVGAIYLAQISIVPAIVGQAVLEIQDGNNPVAEVTASQAGVMAQWFGPEGIRFFNQLKVVPIAGQMTGAIYARYARALGYT